MNAEETRTKVLEVLSEIAPEADLTTIKPDIPFRDQIDLDSIDYLNFVIALDERFDAAIPEVDYTKFMTLNGCVEELKSLLSARSGSQHIPKS